MSYFYKLFRKRGFGDTIITLYQFDKFRAKQVNLYKALKNNGSCINAFLRARDDLVNNNLIEFRLDENNEKIIYLTDKGKEFYKRIKEIEDLLLNNQ
ncbi:MAG: hypothetical protein ACTSU2_04405 [Promethearchaeota archaeon]